MSNAKKRLLVLFTLIGVAVAGSAAYAYWTAGGTGTGSATTGTNAQINAIQTSTVSNMYPGGPDQALSGVFNNGNPGPTYVTSVTVTISSVTTTGGAAITGCDANDYLITGGTMAVGKDVAAGNPSGSFSGATIKMINRNANQDACKNAKVNLAYTIA